MCRPRYVPRSLDLLPSIFVPDNWFWKRSKPTRRKNCRSAKGFPFSNISSLLLMQSALSTFGILQLQVLPYYFVSFGGSVTFVGLSLSAAKAGLYISTVAIPFLLSRLSMLHIFYLQLFVGKIGVTLVFIANFLHSSLMMLTGMLCIGSLSSQNILLHGYIQANMPISQHARHFIYLNLCQLFGALLGPVIATFCNSALSQMIVPFGFAGANLLITCIRLYNSFGFRSETFSRIMHTAVSSGRRSNMVSTEFIAVFYVIGSVFPLISTSMFQTLSTITCQSSFGWGPNEMSQLILPYLITGVVALCVLPSITSCLGILRTLVLSVISSVMTISIVAVNWNSESPMPYIIASCLSNVSTMIMSILPTTIMSTVMDMLTFQTALVTATLLDSLIGLFCPTIWTSIYTMLPEGFWTANLMVLILSSLAFAHSLMYVLLVLSPFLKLLGFIM